MSGLYNTVLGDGHEVDRWTLFSAILGEPNVGRYRDSWIERGRDDNPVIAVYTRNGGGNRECVDCEQWDGDCPGCAMREIVHHPLYLEDGDDEFDPTYATIRFALPDDLPRTVEAVFRESATARVDMSDHWEKLIDALRAEAAH